MKKTAAGNGIKGAALILVLAAVAFLVLSPIPVADAEDTVQTLADVVPVYQPIELEAVMVDPLDYGSAVPYAPHESGFSADGKGYLDETISVRIDEFRWFDTNIWVTWVQIADASQLRAASNKRFPSDAIIRATSLAKREKAVLAIDGDYIVDINTGYSVRNGVVNRTRYNDREAHNYDVMLIDSNGDLTIIRQMDEKKIEAYNAEHTLIHAYTFGPALVVDGVKNEDYPVKRYSATHRTQRMAFGQMDKLSYVIVTTEGPDDKTSTGLTMTELADVMVALGAKNAYNLDGGSSTNLILNYERVNKGHGSTHREIADILYFVTAAAEE